ncbi:efflux RND transporter permease subunit [Erythrobacter sp. HL-111]|uniref:efflux RND transporter permease subunit n=1 Tax=Erythrobacter sp. HL-111 TaxID=1798193 RepID=UPI0006D956F6|nr:efflux RND transporter permease subunit [Erythrobacter sp. HL-111]KPP95447.1 MAG: Cation/multidrug efflux pump [Erythrobacteraceae bacterium HL-111]SDS70962.1 AcrB/AcrD/AcrF family protein [Erythrobacter sp. HL-111]
MSLRNISAWSIRNPVIPLVLFTALLFAGVVSFLRMDVTNNPDVDFPAVTVNIAQPGASPVEIENQITQRVEAAVRSINGVNSIQSTAAEGSSVTFVEFEIGTDLIEAVSEVTTAIDSIRGQLPDGILEPRVQKVQVVGEPIGYFAVEADDMTIEELSWFIDDTVSKRLLKIDGMAEVERFGGVDREIEVILDPQRMQALGVTASQVNNVLRQTNLDAAGGLTELGGTRQSLRVLGNAATAYDLSQRQIQLGGGRTIRLSDVARVRDGYSERTSLSEVEGKEVVNFLMNRARGSSDLAVYDAALAEMDAMEQEFDGIEFIRLGTSTNYTRDQYTSSMWALVEGALLAVVIVFLFLRDWRATFISAVAIPLSAIPTFWFMDLLGFNLNFLSLLALALVAGVLVDDAIVEIENIVRHMRMGKSAYQASIDAADEIGLPVVATSFCIVAVFLPVGLMPGVSGQFFQNFGLTVVVAVLMSLAVARMVTPLMAAYFLKAQGQGAHGEGVWMDRYMAVLGWTLDTGKMAARRAGIEGPRSRWLYMIALLLTVVLLLLATGLAMFTVFDLLTGLGVPEKVAGAVSSDPYGTLHHIVAKTFEIVIVLLTSAIAFLAGWGVFKLVELAGGAGGRFGQGMRYLTARFYDHRVWMLGVGWFSLLVTILLFGQIPAQFQPTIDEENSRVEIETVPGTTLAETKRIVNSVAERLEQEPEVERQLQRIRLGASSSIFVKLTDDRERSSIEFERELAPALAQIPDARVRFQSQSAGFGSGRDITVMLAGSDPELLEETALELVEQMKGLDTLVAPRIAADLNRPEIIITPREKIAAELGVTTAALSQTIRIATLGEIEQNAARFSLADRQIPITVRLSDEARGDLTNIRNLPVQTAGGGSVPLGRVAEIEFGSGPTTIQRYNQSRRVLVGADLASGVLKGEAQAQVDALPVLQDLPTGVIRDVVGEEEWQAELVQNLIIAIISGLLLVFAVLVLLYKRLMSPLVNMTSLALAPLGGVLMIWLVGMPQSMPVYIGILLLLGIVSKNSILLIDFAIEEMDRGTSKLEAIMEAGHKRAQPIVMTTVAMTAGMVPVAISLSGDGAWRQPMGIVVIGGLLLSTLLTLLIVPAGFSLADGFEKRVGPWLRERMLTYRPGDDGRPAPPQGGVPQPAGPRPDAPAPGGAAAPARRLPPGVEPAE